MNSTLLRYRVFIFIIHPRGQKAKPARQMELFRKSPKVSDRSPDYGPTDCALENGYEASQVGGDSPRTALGSGNLLLCLVLALMPTGADPAAQAPKGHYCRMCEPYGRQPMRRGRNGANDENRRCYHTISDSCRRPELGFWGIFSFDLFVAVSGHLPAQPIQDQAQHVGRPQSPLERPHNQIGPCEGGCIGQSGGREALRSSGW